MFLERSNKTLGRILIFYPDSSLHIICVNFFLLKKNGGRQMKKIKAIIASLALFAMFAGTAAQAKVEIQW